MAYYTMELSPHTKAMSMFLSQCTKHTQTAVFFLQRRRKEIHDNVGEFANSVRFNACELVWAHVSVCVCNLGAVCVCVKWKVFWTVSPASFQPLTIPLQNSVKPALKLNYIARIEETFTG